MQHGHIDLGFDKVVMFGIAGSGKTCSLHALLGLPPPPDRSTPLMERPIHVMVISGDDGKQLKVMSKKDVHKRIAQIIRSQPSTSLVASSSSDNTSQELPTITASQPHPPTKEGTHVASVAIPPTAQSESDVDAALDAVIKEATSEMEKDFVSLMNTEASSIDKPILRQDWLYVIDSGGQPQFHEVLPIFLNGATHFVFVFRINEELSDRPKITFRYDDGKSNGESEYESESESESESEGESENESNDESKRGSERDSSFSFLTNEDILKQCMHTMCSFTSKNEGSSSPHILILGTHRDKVKKKDLDKKLDVVNEIVKQVLPPHLKNRVFHKGNDYVFAVKAYKPHKKDREFFRKYREKLNEQQRKGRKKIPLRWHALEYMLQLVASKLERQVLSLHECQEIAKKSLEIDGESCEEALKFFSKLNLLFYWPDILPDLVFVEPQVILDKVTELVVKIHKLGLGEELVVGDEWCDFLKYGKVTEKFLSLHFAKHYTMSCKPKQFTAKELIELFRNLRVFAKLSNDAWFMPSLLKVEPKEKVMKYRENLDTALVVHFPEGVPKVGMFCCMVASILSPDDKSKCQWKVLEDEGGPKCLTRHVIKFDVSGYTGSVTMLDCLTHFEVYVETPTGIEKRRRDQLWCEVYSSVFEAIDVASKKLGYGGKKPEHAIMCRISESDHVSNPHYATLNSYTYKASQPSYREWKCSKDKEKGGTVELDSIPWWKASMACGKLL